MFTLTSDFRPVPSSLALWVLDVKKKEYFDALLNSLRDNKDDLSMLVDRVGPMIRDVAAAVGPEAL